MKSKQKIYFKNCTLKFTHVERVKVEDVISFKYSSVVIKGCIVIKTEGLQTIEYIYNEGINLYRKKKRSKSLKFSGTEITEFQFELLLRKWEVECLEAQKELKKGKQIDLNNFPCIK